MKIVEKYIINSGDYTSIETSIKLNEIYVTDHLTKCYYKYKFRETDEFVWEMYIPDLTNIEDVVPAWSCADMLKMMEPIETQNTRFIFNMKFNIDNIYMTYTNIIDKDDKLVDIKGTNLPELLADVLIQIKEYI